MDKFDIIESIILYLNGVSGVNYQYELKKIFKEYYEAKGYKFEMPRHYGGDKSNDGWVKNILLYYQIYAPVQLNKSLKKDIQKKFKDDLTNLLENIFNKGLWGKDINEFIFIVNTFDTELPEDSEGYFEKEVSNLKNKYNCDFKYRVVNNDYIRDILLEIEDKDILLSIASNLRIKNLILTNGVDESIMIDLISNISKKIHEKYFENIDEDYTRISTPEKIKINELFELEDEINRIMEDLWVVEQSMYIINSNLDSEIKFQKVRRYIIKLYLGYKKDKHISNVDILKNMHNDILGFVQDKAPYIYPTKYLLVYIFDHCDIFEKE